MLFLPGLHALRRTFLSVADDLGVPRHAQMLLSNHSFAGRDVHEDYLRAEWSRLRAWVEQIDRAPWERLGGRRPRRSSLSPIAVASESEPAVSNKCDVSHWYLNRQCRALAAVTSEELFHVTKRA